MKEISLTQGKVAQVSDHRFEYLNQFNWYAVFHGKTWYAKRHEGKFPFRKTIPMHREIMGVTDPKVLVDHRDEDGLNNQDDNLRVCNNSQNACNRGKTRKNTSGYKGVYWHKLNKKFYTQIQVDGKFINLGYFKTIIEAARAYDEAAIKYFGEFAKLNFPQE